MDSTPTKPLSYNDRFAADPSFGGPGRLVVSDLDTAEPDAQFEPTAPVQSAPEQPKAPETPSEQQVTLKQTEQETK